LVRRLSTAKKAISQEINCGRGRVYTPRDPRIEEARAVLECKVKKVRGVRWRSHHSDMQGSTCRSGGWIGYDKTATPQFKRKVQKHSRRDYSQEESLSEKIG